MRYIEMNPVRAGMVEHPAQYRWSSYAANAQGIDNAIIQPHELYLSLGKTPEARQAAYRGLFATAIHSDELDLVRASLHSGTPLGNDCFKKKIESVVGCTVGFSKRGRPLNIKPASDIGRDKVQNYSQATQLCDTVLMWGFWAIDDAYRYRLRSRSSHVRRGVPILKCRQVDRADFVEKNRFIRRS